MCDVRPLLCMQARAFASGRQDLVRVASHKRGQCAHPFVGSRICGCECVHGEVPALEGVGSCARHVGICCIRVEHVSAHVSIFVRFCCFWPAG